MPLTFERLNYEKKRSAEIVSVIKNKLLDGSLKPGDKLPTEMEMAEQLGVSRTPVREAIKILEAIGIIEIKRGEGMFIRQTISNFNLNPLIFSLILHSNNIRKLIEFRQHFEKMLIEMIGTHCSLEDLEKIKRVYESQIERMDPSLSFEELAQIDLEFHYAVLEATKNPFVIEIGKTIYELSKPKIMKLVEQFGVEQPLSTHKMYLDALYNAYYEGNALKSNEVKQKIEDNWRWFEKGKA